MRVLICGAGIAGLTLGWSLERRGHDVVLIERSPRPRGPGFMLDFFGSGYDAAERMGLLADLAAIHDPVDWWVLLDSDGRERRLLPYSRLRERLFGNRHFNFTRGDLERVLLQKIEGRLAVRFGTTVDSIEQDDTSARIMLSDGTSGCRFDCRRRRDAFTHQAAGVRRGTALPPSAGLQRPPSSSTGRRTCSTPAAPRP